MSDLEKVTELCMQLGSPPLQAKTMARQLLKRADQISVGRKISRAEAMAQLLQILVEGRQGKVPAGVIPPAPHSE